MRSTSARSETSASIAIPPDLGGGLLDLLARAGGDGDARARAGQLERDPAPDPAPAAGDERDPARELRVGGHPPGILR